MKRPEGRAEVKGSVTCGSYSLNVGGFSTRLEVNNLSYNVLWVEGMSTIESLQAQGYEKANQKFPNAQPSFDDSMWIKKVETPTFLGL